MRAVMRADMTEAMIDDLVTLVRRCTERQQQPQPVNGANGGTKQQVYLDLPVCEHAPAEVKER